MASRIKEKRRRRDRDGFIKKLLSQPVPKPLDDNDHSAVPHSDITVADIALARRQLDTGHAIDCEEICRRILSADTQRPDAMHLFGMACYLNDGHRQAVDLLNRAIALAPDNPEFHASLGLIHGREGRFLDAVSALRQSLKLQPDNVDVLYNLGLAYVQAGDVESAIAVYERAIAAHPNIAALYLNCGSALQMAGRHGEAETSYRKVIALDPQSVDAYYNLGMTLGRLNRFTESLDALEHVIALSPAHPGAHRSIGETRLKIGDNAGAATALRHTTELIPDDLKIRFDLSHALALSGETGDAVAICEQAIKIAPPTVENLITLCIAYICHGNHEAAIEVCDAVLAKSPGHTSAVAFKATALTELGRSEEARYLQDLDSLVQCFVLDPPDGYADMTAFNDALRQHIQHHPTLRDYATNRSLNNGQATQELLDERPGPFSTFEEMIQETIAEYKGALTVAPDHPFQQNMQSRLKLEVWANIMDTAGFHDTHFHPTGCLSGTYYPASPPISSLQDPAGAGCIEFGRSLYSLPTTVEPVTRTVQPQESMVVLFPSYLGHRTIPFESEEKRFSIAFDAIAQR